MPLRTQNEGSGGGEADDQPDEQVRPGGRNPGTTLNLGDLIAQAQDLQPDRPSIQQIAEKRGFDVFGDENPADKALQRLNPYSFEERMQERVSEASWTKYHSLSERVDAIERYSRQLLPTEMSLALGQSKLPDVDIERAARLFARQLSTPIAQLFPSRQVGNGSVFINPVTGKKLTLAAARRLYKPYERDFFQKLVESSGEDPAEVAAWFRALSPIKGEQLEWDKSIGMAIALSRNLPTEIIGPFRKNLSLIGADPNLKNPLTGKVMTEEDRVTLAYSVASQNITFQDGSDVVNYLLGSNIGPEPQKGTQEHKAWVYRNELWQRWTNSSQGATTAMQIAQGEGSELWESKYQELRAQFESQYGSIWTDEEIDRVAREDTEAYFQGQREILAQEAGGMPVTADGSLTEFALNLPEDQQLALKIKANKKDEEFSTAYNDMIQVVNDAYQSDEDASKNSLMGKVTGVVGRAFDISSDLVNTTLYTAGTGLGVGIRLAISPLTGESMDHLNHDAQTYMDQARLMLWSEAEGGDNYGLAMALTEDLARAGHEGPGWNILANMTELSAQLALDPTNFVFGIGKFQKLARMGDIKSITQVDNALAEMKGWEKAMRGLAGGSDTLLAPTFPERVLEFLSKPMGKLDGSSVPDWLVAKARQYKDSPEDFYDAVSYKFRSPTGAAEGVPPQVVDALHRWVNLSDAHKLRNEAELSDDVSDIMATVFGVKPERIQTPNGLADILEGIDQGRRYGLMEHEWARNAPLTWTYAPKFQPWMANEAAVKDAENVISTLWNYWDAKPGAMTSMAIPQIGGKVADMRTTVHHALMESWFGPGVRYRRSVIPTMAANLEDNFPQWIVNYMNRSKGLFTRKEIAEAFRTASGIADPFAQGRESAFIRMLEGLQEKVIQRLGKKYGLSEREILAHLEDTRKRTKDLNRHLYGISDENIEDWNAVLEGDFRSVRSPQFVTQLPNVWMTSDPVRFQRLLQESLGYRQRVTEGVRRVFGKQVSDEVRNALTGGETTKLKPATVNHLVNSLADRLRTAQSYWKSAIVATPRYLFRVPMGDEQLRFIADTGVLGWAGSRKHVAGIVNKLPNHKEFIEFDVKNSDFFVRLNREAMDSGFANLDDALDAEILKRKGVTGDDKVDLLDSMDPDVYNVVKSTVDKATELEYDLSKGIAGFLADEGLVVRVPAPAPGELLDEAGVNASRATSVFESHEQQARNMLERMRKWSSQNERFWDEIRPTDKNYGRALSHVLVNQVGRDPLGSRILRAIVKGQDSDRIQADIVQYLAKNEWGRNVAQRLGLKSRAALEEHAEIVERMIRDWTMGDEVMATAALKGNGSLIERMADEWIRHDPEALSAVHGFKAAQVLDRSYPGKFLWDTYTKAIFELPTNKLSRQPFFKHWYTQYREGLLKIAKDQELDMTPELLRKIEAEARAHAIERTQAIMFDFRRESRFGEMLWFVAPFYQPFMEAFQVWGKLLRKNPVFANRARIWLTEAEENDWIRTDPVTGEKTIPLSNMWFGAPLLNMAFGGFGEDGFRLSGPLNSLNFVFGSVFELPTGKIAGNVPLPVPSLNPALMVFGQKVATSEYVPDPIKWSMLNWAFQYGDSGNNVGEFGMSLLPTYVQHALRGLGVGDQDILKSQAGDFVRLYEAQGMTPIKLATDDAFAREMTGREFKSVDEAKAYLADKAWHQARQLSGWRSVMSAFFPVAPSVKFPTENLELEYRDYIEEFGYDVGRDKFLEKYPEHALITIPSTYWNRPDSTVPLPANRLAETILSQPGAKQFAKDNPQWAFALLPQEVWAEEFDRATFFRQMANGDRATRGPLDMFTAADEQAGWELYFDAKQNSLAELDALKAKGITEADPVYQAAEAKFDRIVESAKVLYPGFRDKINVFDTSNLDPWVEFGVDNALKSELFRGTATGQFLLGYRQLRERVMGRMEELGLHTLSTVSAETYGVKQEYEEGVEQLLAQYGPDAERTYNYFFRKDLQAVKTRGDRLIDKVSQDPDAYQGYLRWSTRFNEARKTAANSSSQAAVTKAYLTMRQMTDTAYTLHGNSIKNPQQLWWETRTQAEKDAYTESVLGRPYVFLSRFDREVILGEKTSDEAEDAWNQVGRFDLLIARVKERSPNASTSSLYDARDAMVRQLAAKDEVFAKQVAHANVWGYTYWHGGELENEPGREGEAWRTLHGAVENIQEFVNAKGLHGEADFGIEREIYRELKQRLLSVVTYLKDYSPAFKSRWEQLESASTGPDLIDDFMPEIWFKLGGKND